MLVLSRKPDQSVLIGGNLEVFVVSVDCNRVRLGFRVPREITVHRKEIADEVLREGGELLDLVPMSAARAAG